MRKVLFITAALLLMIVAACTQEAIVIQNEDSEIQSITVIGPAPIQFEPITGDVPTKGTSVQDGNALLFNWAVGDTLGIFPNQGNQVEFPITAAQGSTSATFDGGGWALRNNASYAAYYPFSVWNYHRDNETILLDYSGQVQDGNGSFAHLSAYDYLASNKTTPLNSSVTFQMDRQGSILYIDIVVPEPETITALEVSCDEAIFTEKASLDISGNTPVVTPLEMTKTLRLEFVNTATTTDNETVRAYMAVQPLDFSTKTVTATLYTATGSYVAPVTSRVVNKGRAAFLRFSDDFTPVNIEFADAEVKRICVENWDTNGDGELSYKEAAAVTEIWKSGTQGFQYNTLITSFNEFVHFTGVTSIPNNTFRSCNNLEAIILPEHIVSIGGAAFYDTKIDTIVLPESVTWLGGERYQSYETDVFARTYLTHINIPNSVVSIGRGIFRECAYLESISGKFASLDGNSLVVDGRLVASALAGINEYIVPSDVITIDNYAIYDANASSGLARIIIPEGIERIENLAIYHVGIRSISIPNSLMFLGEGNFSESYKLENFAGKYASPDGRCLIYEGTLIAFAHYNCGTEFEVPSGVVKIGRDAFNACNTLISITLPETVESIGWEAFFGCNLQQITLPESLKSIGYYSFGYNQNLSSITCLSQIPPSAGQGMFEGTNNCPIYVPNESVDAYKTASGWSAYADRIFGIDVDGSVVGPDPQNPD